MLDARHPIDEPLLRQTAPHGIRCRQKLNSIPLFIGLSTAGLLILLFSIHIGGHDQEPTLSMAYRFQALPRAFRRSQLIARSPSRAWSAARLVSGAQRLTSRSAKKKPQDGEDPIDKLYRLEKGVDGPAKENGVDRNADDKKLVSKLKEDDPEAVTAALSEVWNTTGSDAFRLQDGGSSAADVAASAKVAQMPFDPAFPGLRLLNADPPVVAIDGFVSDKTCTALRVATEVYGQPSEEGPVSMVLDDEMLQREGEALKSAQEELRDKAKTLLAGLQWSLPGELPPAGTFCFEQLQVVKYQQGQSLPSHEDGFPQDLAKEWGFQRRATLQVYLNDVAEGGETKFQIGVSFKPTAGTAILFFPALADGTPDIATMYAEDKAVNTKFVAQQWICGGWSDVTIPVAETSGKQ